MNNQDYADYVEQNAPAARKALGTYFLSGADSRTALTLAGDLTAMLAKTGDYQAVEWAAKFQLDDDEGETFLNADSFFDKYEGEAKWQAADRAREDGEPSVYAKHTYDQRVEMQAKDSMVDYANRLLAGPKGR